LSDVPEGGGRASVVVVVVIDVVGRASEAAGAADSDGVEAGGVPGSGVDGAEVSAGGSITLDELSLDRVRTDKPREVKKKRTAAPIVSLLKNVAAPRLPNTVWLDPPKAAPMSAPLPD
jgi:hypothetical protein